MPTIDTFFLNEVFTTKPKVLGPGGIKIICMPPPRSERRHYVFELSVRRVVRWFVQSFLSSQYT